MASAKIQVEVAYAEPERQALVALCADYGTTVAEAIGQSGILRQFPQIDMAVNRVGIFGKLCKLEQILENGDRVEIYRPLAQHPMDARRNRAVRR